VGIDAINALEKIPVLSRGTLRSEIAGRMLMSIFRGELPERTRLLVMKLAERFGTSSTPVREALVELESIGVVHFVPNRGAEVAPFGPQQLREIYQVRRVLETEAARCACGHLPSESLEQFRAEMARLLETEDGTALAQEATEADLQLHGAVLQAAGSQRLSYEVSRYETLVQAIREIIGPNGDAIRRALREHVVILDALLAEDADAAARAMSFHIDSAAEVSQAAMFDNRPPSAAAG
jgi:DNA-binding GntR family transcriptional regulator